MEVTKESKLYHGLTDAIENLFYLLSYVVLTLPAFTPVHFRLWPRPGGGGFSHFSLFSSLL